MATYSSVVKAHGLVPLSETLQCIDLQKSSDGVVEVDFATCQEMLINNKYACKICKAEDATAAGTIFGSGDEFEAVSADTFKSYFNHDNLKLYVLNDLDEDKTLAINITRYFY